jgi:hypothetical protein
MITDPPWDPKVDVAAAVSQGEGKRALGKGVPSHDAKAPERLMDPSQTPSNAAPASGDQARRVRAAMSLSFIGVGALFLAFALLKPSFAWDLGKVESGRAVLGETGMTVAFVGLGAVVTAGGIALLMRR